MPAPDLKDLFQTFPDLPWSRVARRPVADRVRMVRERAAARRQQLRLSVDSLHTAAAQARVKWVRQRAADVNEVSARISRIQRLLDALPTGSRPLRVMVQQLRQELYAISALFRARR